MDYSNLKQQSLFDFPKYKIPKNKEIRLIELFGGIGSQAMALRNIGANFKHWRLCEIDAPCVKNYNKIHGTDFSVSDISKIHAEDLGITETDKYCYLMTYSFCCQGLSKAGLQKGMARGSGTRSGLLWEVERLLLECKEKPNVLLMENVPQVHSESNFADWIDWNSSLLKMGYHSFFADLNARDYGIPQNRNRCFMVSILTDEEIDYDFPQKEELTVKAKDFLEQNVDESFYINTERADELIEKLILKGELEDSQNFIDKSMKLPKSKTVANTIKCGNRGIVNHQAEENGVVEKTVIPLNLSDDCSDRTIKAQYYKNSIQNFESHGTFGATGVVEQIVCCVDKNGANGTYCKASESVQNGLNAEFIHTITTCEGLGMNAHHSNMIIEKGIRYRVRKLTCRESWRLMGFLDQDFDKVSDCPKTTLYKQAGNSIVVPVLEKIFSNLIEA